MEVLRLKQGQVDGSVQIEVNCQLLIFAFTDEDDGDFVEISVTNDKGVVRDVAPLGVHAVMSADEYPQGYKVAGKTVFFVELGDDGYLKPTLFLNIKSNRIGNQYNGLQGDMWVYAMSGEKQATIFNKFTKCVHNSEFVVKEGGLFVMKPSDISYIQTNTVNSPLELMAITEVKQPEYDIYGRLQLGYAFIPTGSKVGVSNQTTVYSMVTEVVNNVMDKIIRNEQIKSKI